MKNSVRLEHGWEEGGKLKEMRMAKEIIKILTNTVGGDWYDTADKGKSMGLVSKEVRHSPLYDIYLYIMITVDGDKSQGRS